MLLLAGSGSRFKGRIPKQFIKLPGSEDPLFICSIKEIAKITAFNQLILVVNPDYLNQPDFTEPLATYIKDNPAIVLHVIAGAASRHESFLKGASLLNSRQNDEVLLVHDANRPFISKKFAHSILENISTLSASKPCLIPVVPIIDSVCLAKDNHVLDYPNRDSLFRIQTPQMIFLPALLAALSKLTADKNKSGTTRQSFTDEGSFMLAMGFPVFTYPGDTGNIKITYEGDI